MAGISPVARRQVGFLLFMNGDRGKLARPRRFKLPVFKFVITSAELRQALPSPPLA
jgi:hypothetical protein